MAYSNIGGAGTLIRSGNSAILPISDAQFIQYENDDLDVVNVRDGLDALSDNVSSLTDDTPFWVTISDDRGTLSCSHTYAQITAQIAAGKKVLALYSPSSEYSQECSDDRPVVLNCVWTDGETILRFRASTGRGCDIIEFFMDETRSIRVTTYTYARDNHTHTNESMGQGYGTTAAGTTTTTASITNYKLKVGGIASIRFTNAVPASATLNINSTGAKSIYYNNAAITANVIKAGDTATFMYDGTYYRLISIDKTAPLDSPALSGTPTAPTAAAGTNTTQIATTAFVTTAISNASSALKYTIKNPSSNAASFSTSSKMQPNTVYIVGSGSGTSFAWSKINTLSIPTGSLDGDLGVLWRTGNNSQLPNTSSAPQVTTGMTVGTYQILWIAGTSGTSITLPSSVKWKSGIAPDSRDMVNRLCELTIMNGLATINIS